MNHVQIVVVKYVFQSLSFEPNYFCVIFFITYGLYVCNSFKILTIGCLYNFLEIFIVILRICQSFNCHVTHPTIPFLFDFFPAMFTNCYGWLVLASLAMLIHAYLHSVFILFDVIFTLAWLRRRDILCFLLLRLWLRFRSWKIFSHFVVSQ